MHHDHINPLADDFVNYHHMCKEKLDLDHSPAWRFGNLDNLAVQFTLPCQ